MQAFLQEMVDAALADAEQLRSALSSAIPAAQSQRDALVAHSVEAAAAAAMTDGQTEDPEALVSHSNCFQRLFS